MKRTTSPIKSVAGAELDLSYFVEWRGRLWAPAVEYLLQDPTRFVGKKVMELGCRHGRMSCLFGLLGASVVGVELSDVSLENARDEARRWNLEERVSFTSYDGDPANLPAGDFDYVFTKSVLVVVSDLEAFLSTLATKMKSGGELMVAENLTGGRALRLARRLVTYTRHSDLKDRFEGVDDRFVTRMNGAFNVVGMQTYYGSVAAIRAVRK